MRWRGTERTGNRRGRGLGNRREWAWPSHLTIHGSGNFSE